MKIENKNLFFAYALPCLVNFVKRGEIPESRAKNLLERFKNGKKLPDNTEKIFQVALFYMGKIAKRMGKKVIDDEVIRKYFLEEHNDVVDKRKVIDKCKIKIGKVIKIQKKFILVKVEGKIRKYDTFVKNLKVEDKVVLHWYYIIEKLEKNKKILVFGNYLIKKDSLALKVANYLKKDMPQFEFKEFDTSENLEKEGKDITILDVVEGLKRVEVIQDIKRIKRENIFSLHDFDLSYELELLMRLKLIDSFRIIGIPTGSKIKEIVSQVKEILSNPSYF